MSFFVDKEWFYYLRGREILVYKFRGGAGVGRISQNGVFQSYDKELMYPDEDIADGLRIEYTRVSEPFVAEALETTTSYESGVTISFEDGTGSSSRDVIDLGSTATTEFVANDKIRVRGSASNDGDYTILAIATDGSTSYRQLEVAAGSFTTEAIGERISITQIPVEVAAPDSTSHINLNKMLSLAVLDYCKGMLAERNGELDRKEYYMKEFYGKLGDNESNKRNISVTFPSGPFAVR
tara:strand:+ start:614 stop:1327 length:714 start_codon:yes stop_codon:yes gene_type:complete